MSHLLNAANLFEKLDSGARNALSMASRDTNGLISVFRNQGSFFCPGRNFAHYAPTKLHIDFDCNLGQLLGGFPFATYIKISDPFRAQIHNLPNRVTKLCLGGLYQTLLPYVIQIKLPQQLTHLRLGRFFNNQTVFPPQLTHLELGYFFDQAITLPITLISLKLGSMFNNLLMLPSHLAYLYLGSFFNKPITLPSTLKKVRFGSHFNHLVTLPPNLTHAEFGNNYDQPTRFPEGIKQLSFGDKWNQQVTFPQSVEFLAFQRPFRGRINLLLNLKVLRMSQFYPFSLRHLLPKTSVVRFNSQVPPFEIEDEPW
eukprot:TRINITY_DN5084_c0_g1_i6.p1 TRINITY_DN5084_c0_g1~~TRINITY_DN5084_c0_g1_i6.p1  ORF type:complete len:312 (+),score=31.73 TRINITY_DN5084_c0_g1_i6:224-1159(+)